MSLKTYGVLKGRVLGHMLSGDESHLEIEMLAHNNATNKKDKYRIALNVRSQSIPPELNYIIFKNFDHPFTKKLLSLEEGITTKVEKPSVALDYIRSNLFDFKWMRRAQHISSGDNELSDTIGLYIERASKTENAMIYAFGEHWGPEDKNDEYFGFNPGQGIHDIHMNQGNAGRWVRDNGVFQDGGLFIHFPDEKRWVAIFLAFRSQSFYTDDIRGDPVKPDLSKENSIVIIAALLRSHSKKSNVSLLNISDKTVDLTGWSLAGLKKTSQKLRGKVDAGDFFTVEIDKSVVLSSNGGIITLFDNKNTKICGVSYTTPEYNMKDRITVFYGK